MHISMPKTHGNGFIRRPIRLCVWPVHREPPDAAPAFSRSVVNRLVPAVVPAVVRRRGGPGLDPGGPAHHSADPRRPPSDGNPGRAADRAWPLGLFAVAAVPGSLLVARIGMRRTMLIGLALTALASAGRSASLNAWMLYGTTALMGFGVAIMQPALPALVRAWVPTHVGLGTAVSTNGIGDRRHARLGAVDSVSCCPGWAKAGGSTSSCGRRSLGSSRSSSRRSARVRYRPTRTSCRQPNAGGPDWKSPLTWLLGLAFGST